MRPVRRSATCSGNAGSSESARRASCAPSAPADETSAARDGSRGDPSYRLELVATVAARFSEGAQELRIRVGAALDLSGVEVEEKPEAPGELCVLLRQPRRRRVDLGQRNATAELALQLGAAFRRLLGVHAIHDEGLLDDVGLGARQHPRPQLVVLALAERLVVAEPVPGEVLSVEHDRVVEERRGREQRVPARHRGASLRHVHGAEPTAGLHLEHARPDQHDGRPAVEAREDTLEPVRKRDVVRVHAGNAASSHLVESEVERTGEP